MASEHRIAAALQGALPRYCIDEAEVTANNFDLGYWARIAAFPIALSDEAREGWDTADRELRTKATGSDECPACKGEGNCIHACEPNPRKCEDCGGSGKATEGGAHG